MKTMGLVARGAAVIGAGAAVAGLGAGFRGVEGADRNAEFDFRVICQNQEDGTEASVLVLGEEYIDRPNYGEIVGQAVVVTCVTDSGDYEAPEFVDTVNGPGVVNKAQGPANLSVVVEHEDSFVALFDSDPEYSGAETNESAGATALRFVGAMAVTGRELVPEDHAN
jgi:hypothetical protein